jgi:hypothetical protein
MIQAYAELKAVAGILHKKEEEKAYRQLLRQGAEPSGSLKHGLSLRHGTSSSKIIQIIP